MTPHAPVLLKEVLEALDPHPGDLVVDATFGAGGYASAFIAAGAKVIAFDRDPSAAAIAAPLVAGGALTFVNARFSEMGDWLPGPCQGVAFDLGVSSMQLDQAERGFSFLRDGPLDMRMGQSGVSAADLVNTWERDELAKIFFEFGEERGARRIATVICRRRAERPFLRTADLASVVEAALGGRRGARIHPATRVFQALRIAVNGELDELRLGLTAAERALGEGGRLAVVTFHSLEDRIVKAFFHERSGRAGQGSRHLPPGAAGPEPTFRLAFAGVRSASEAECSANPRARSAKLRAGVRTGAPAWREAA